ncbi:hypothetical protein E4T56_gene19048 [Termitomyces sp. T112]|nr:hypothetical protein E4T56_gene19048 [Termitomyces sp. T112]
MLLDIPNLATEFRRHFMNAMLKLSRRSKFYPSPLLQHQVLLEGAYAVASGQFGDVWKGTFRNQQVAVKVLRFFASSEPEASQESPS